MKQIKFFDEKKKIVVLKYSKALVTNHDRNSQNIAVQAAFDFWRITWPEDFVDEDGQPLYLYKKLLWSRKDDKPRNEMVETWDGCVKYFKTQTARKMKKSTVNKLYEQRGAARYATKVPKELRELAGQKGLKIWHTNDTWTLSGFKIMRGKDCLAGERFDLTAEDVMDFIKNFEDNNMEG